MGIGEWLEEKVEEAKNTVANPFSIPKKTVEHVQNPGQAIQDLTGAGGFEAAPGQGQDYIDEQARKKTDVSRAQSMLDDFDRKRATVTNDRIRALNDPIRLAIRDRLRGTRESMAARGLLNSGIRKDAEGGVLAQGASAMAKNTNAVNRAMIETKKRLTEIYNQIIYDQKVEAIETADEIYDAALRNSQLELETSAAVGNAAGTAAGMYFGSQSDDVGWADLE